MKLPGSLGAFWDESCKGFGVHECIYPIVRGCPCEYSSKRPVIKSLTEKCKIFLEKSCQNALAGIFERCPQKHRCSIV